MERHYNLDFLKDYYGDDMPAMSIVLKLYLEETPKQLEEIEMHLLNKNVAGAKAGTHKIKTNLAMLGIVDPANFINAMHQHAADNNDFEGIMPLFKLFKSELLKGMKDIESDFFSRK
jgi:HPt (histidine-containing phosphotransfer) domain-containing protein